MIIKNKNGIMALGNQDYSRQGPLPGDRDMSIPEYSPFYTLEESNHTTCKHYQSSDRQTT